MFLSIDYHSLGKFVNPSLVTIMFGLWKHTNELEYNYQTLIYIQRKASEKAFLWLSCMSSRKCIVSHSTECILI